jgi:hypothetical protein
MGRGVKKKEKKNAKRIPSPAPLQDWGTHPYRLYTQRIFHLIQSEPRKPANIPLHHLILWWDVTVLLPIVHRCYGSVSKLETPFNLHLVKRARLKQAWFAKGFDQLFTGAGNIPFEGCSTDISCSLMFHGFGFVFTDLKKIAVLGGTVN